MCASLTAAPCRDVPLLRHEDPLPLVQRRHVIASHHRFLRNCPLRNVVIEGTWQVLYTEAVLRQYSQVSRTETDVLFIQGCKRTVILGLDIGGECDINGLQKETFISLARLGRLRGAAALSQADTVQSAGQSTLACTSEKSRNGPDV
ncbi:hypothetical protein E2C01_077563 [Portunus trituberculatus]|uniref:Uncharacterized protein n=1 Tax=Portunus trituberculatus TaxID=210409 RepID=A0A5B7IMF2_PORTR|nr:hypothetical protein [Portunus trituberculatus]